jgi:hypothetical protein
VKKQLNNISGLLGLAYLPTTLVCGIDPHPQPGKLVKVPHAPLGTKPIYAPSPKYPLEARQKHWEGMMLLELQIRPDGTVRDAKVLQSTGACVAGSRCSTSIPQMEIHIRQRRSHSRSSHV